MKDLMKMNDEELLKEVSGYRTDLSEMFSDEEVAYINFRLGNLNKKEEEVKIISVKEMINSENE